MKKSIVHSSIGTHSGIARSMDVLLACSALTIFVVFFVIGSRRLFRPHVVLVSSDGAEQPLQQGHSSSCMAGMHSLPAAEEAGQMHRTWITPSLFDRIAS